MRLVAERVIVVRRDLEEPREVAGRLFVAAHVAQQQPAIGERLAEIRR